MKSTADFKHKRRYSQNFLHDLGVLQRIESAIGARPADVFLEVGPGDGALTERLLPTSGAYTALELDARLIPSLTQRFQTQTHFNLIHTDALTYAYEMHQPAPYRLVGNLPYHISTSLMQRFLGASQCIQDMHLMFQKEVAERICAQTQSRKRGRLTLITQLFCECEYLFTIGSESFDPSPKVDSALIRLTPKASLGIKPEHIGDYISIVTQAFSAKRKTIYNNLRTIMSRSTLEDVGIDPDVRAEALDVVDFITITRALLNRSLPIKS